MNYKEIWEKVPSVRRACVSLTDTVEIFFTTKFILFAKNPDDLWERQILLAAFNRLLRDRMMKGALDTTDADDIVLGYIWYHRDKKSFTVEEFMAFMNLSVAPDDPTVENLVQFTDEGYLYTLCRGVTAAAVAIDESMFQPLLKLFSSVKWGSMAQALVHETNPPDSLVGVLTGASDFIEQQDPPVVSLKLYLAAFGEKFLRDYNAFLILDSPGYLLRPGDDMA